jgi:ABC-type Fe3+-hydroxamate transport system substrate-binding protein
MTSPPRRIVSLVPSTTESVCRLGAADRLMGCTRYCEEPAAVLADVPKLGGTKNPNLNAIARLAPDLVLANAEENRPEDIAWLQERMPVLVQTPCTVREARAALIALGECLGGSSADAAHGAAAGRPRLAVFYAIWRKPWMGVARSTYIGDVLAQCGLDVIGADIAGRYPTVPEARIAAEAQVVLLASEPWAFSRADAEQIASEHAFGAATVAWCDGRDFCWHGVRAALGLRHAAALRAKLARSE